VTKGSYCAAALDGLALGKKLADDWAVKYAESSRAVPGSNPLSPIAKTESFAAYQRQAHTEHRQTGDFGGGGQDG
jgi:hypothetical protein